MTARIVSRLRSLAAGMYQCPLCGRWSSYRWTDRWGDRACGRCGSLSRHRLVGCALVTRGRALPGTTGSRRVLHVAPERCLRPLVASLAFRYVTADIALGGADVALDLRAAGLRSSSFEVVVLLDVLEHIDDDLAALREVRRLLAADGLAVVSVPIPDHWPVTYEDPEIVEPERRCAHFGQADHVRVYGDDFRLRLHRAGFDFTEVGALSFSRLTRLRYGLDSHGSHHLTTNQRVVFFAVPRGAEAGAPSTVVKT
jgi:SAM-dependent methyltransferase